MEYSQQALAIRQQIGDRLGEAQNLNSIGLIYDSLGQYPKALEYYQQALAISQQIGDRLGIGNSLNNKIIRSLTFEIEALASAVNIDASHRIGR